MSCAVKEVDPVRIPDPLYRGDQPGVYGLFCQADVVRSGQLVWPDVRVTRDVSGSQGDLVDHCPGHDVPCHFH